MPAAVAASFLAFFLIRSPMPRAASLQARVEPGSTVRRGDGARPGDLLRLAAVTAGARHAELRVYRNDAELILRCSTERPCIRRDGELSASVVLDGVGRYQPLLLLSARPLPAATADLERDTDAALAAGADLKLAPEIVVR